MERREEKEFREVVVLLMMETWWWVVPDIPPFNQIEVEVGGNAAKGDCFGYFQAVPHPSPFLRLA